MNAAEALMSAVLSAGQDRFGRLRRANARPASKEAELKAIAAAADKSARKNQRRAAKSQS